MLCSRRSFLTGVTASLLSRPTLAQAQSWQDSAAALNPLHALVLHRGGEEVFARAWRGNGLDRVANIKSVSKTLVALLTGIAIDRGILEGPAQRVLPLLGRTAFGDARDDLTISDLLSMQAGLASTSGTNYGAWVTSDNWVDYALSQPLAGQPGGRFIYSTGGWHILGAALARASGQSLLAMARDWLGKPIGIDFAPWVRDPQGLYLGGNDMAISPRDLARIGDMVLAEGRVSGQPVVSAEWLRRSFEPRARSPFSGDHYGYGWFLTRFGGHAAYYGRGFGGQMLVVVPGLELSIAIISDLTQPARTDGYFGELRRWLDQIVTEAG